MNSSITSLEVTISLILLHIWKTTNETAKNIPFPLSEGLRSCKVYQTFKCTLQAISCVLIVVRLRSSSFPGKTNVSFIQTKQMGSTLK